MPKNILIWVLFCIFIEMKVEFDVFDWLMVGLIDPCKMKIGVDVMLGAELAEIGLRVLL